uniref:Uncharacterized protein n=1 Tax=Arundo donax TaxID=35708 RepID=A0A0A9BI45_ARUDO
MKDCNRNCS